MKKQPTIAHGLGTHMLQPNMCLGVFGIVTSEKELKPG